MRIGNPHTPCPRYHTWARPVPWPWGKNLPAMAYTDPVFCLLRKCLCVWLSRYRERERQSDRERKKKEGLSLFYWLLVKTQVWALSRDCQCDFTGCRSHAYLCGIWALGGPSESRVCWCMCITNAATIRPAWYIIPVENAIAQLWRHPTSSAAALRTHGPVRLWLLHESARAHWRGGSHARHSCYRYGSRHGMGKARESRRFAGKDARMCGSWILQNGPLWK